MSGDFAIRAEGLGKKYIIGHGAGRERYVALRDVLAGSVKGLVRSAGDMVAGRGSVTGARREEFFALRGVNFEVKQGDVVGIIGRNGAGKSTLLKILSRITEPSEGRVSIRGRVSSLLEVGTGFHPELTGRENIFLNGAILGMRRNEIKRKFDEIVAFAEIAQFLDTPVKRYSSGMYVRLAFAVAAHLEGEILVVDEVLAVGDAEFQKKCLGKMSEVAGGGRTVLFVSHNMAAIENLCDKAMLINRGSISHFGETNAAVAGYLKLPTFSATSTAARRPDWAQPWIQEAWTVDAQRERRANFSLGEAITVEMAVRQPGAIPMRKPVMGVVINHLTRGTIAGINTRMTGFEAPKGLYREGLYRCMLEPLPLLQGEYSLDVWLGDGSSDIDTVSHAATFTINDADIYGSGGRPFSHMGVVFLKARWAFESGADFSPGGEK